jgi:hypothetical protein
MSLKFSKEIDSLFKSIFQIILSSSTITIKTKLYSYAIVDDQQNNQWTFFRFCLFQKPNMRLKLLIIPDLNIA